MRLDKLLAHMGFGSRKDVRHLIRKGHVTVNEKTIRSHGTHVQTDKDIVQVKGENVRYRKYIYLMLNKPDGYISATEDRYDQTVIDLLPDEYHLFEPFPVGRLDKDTEGLLLLTNDGKLAHFLTSPNSQIGKTYYAQISGRVTEQHVVQFKEGLTLDDGYKTRPGKLNILKSGPISKVELTITEGKFHQVKRMFQAVGLKVTYLKRIQMGEIKLDAGLPLGSIRELNEAEYNYCMSVKQRH